MVLDHPEVEWALLTGYPSWNQPLEVKCDICGDYIDDEVYEDEEYENLCLNCLLKIHLKGK